MKGGSKDFWFVLTAETLSWFKDEEVRNGLWLINMHAKSQRLKFISWNKLLMFCMKMGQKKIVSYEK